MKILYLKGCKWLLAKHIKPFPKKNKVKGGQCTDYFVAKETLVQLLRTLFLHNTFGRLLLYEFHKIPAKMTPV